MKTLTYLTPMTVLLAVAVAPAVAQAQAYAQSPPAPMYPYAVEPGPAYHGPYAVEVAPGRYVIHRPAKQRAYPNVRCMRDCDIGTAERRAHRHSAEWSRDRNDPVLIERRRHHGARKVERDVVSTTRIVRDKPVIIEHERVVEDPPHVIERRHYVEDRPARRGRMATMETEVVPPAALRGGKARTIRAEAEVTILGPDRMTIRLFRKGARAARAEAITAEPARTKKKAK